MISFIAIFVGFCLLGAGILAWCAVHAEQGYEDETGFHLKWHNNRPDLVDISCIWSPGGNRRA